MSIAIHDNVIPFAEKHYTVAELSELWKVSPDFITRLFESEPGIFDPQPTPRNRRKRRKRNLRIPQSVAERVYRRNLIQEKP